MAGANKDLKFRLLGEDVSAGSAFASVGKKAGALRGTFAGLGSTLSSVTGGAFGPLSDVISGVGQGFDTFQQHGKKASSVMLGVGIAAVGAGAALTQMGLEDARATALLKQSIESSGNSWSDYEGRVNDVVNRMINFGHESEDTDAALQRLTEATGDPSKAIQNMGLVADIAAAKHQSLADSAGTVSKMFLGNAKAFKQYGVSLDGVGTKEEQIGRAIDEVSKRMAGQASASAGTLAGQLDMVKTKIGETVEGLAKYGPALMAVGTAGSLAGAALRGYNAAMEASAAKALAAKLANTELAASEGAVATGATVATGGIRGMMLALAPAAVVLGPIAVGLALISSEASKTAKAMADGRAEFQKNPAAVDEYTASLKKVDATTGTIIRGYRVHSREALTLRDNLKGATAAQKESADAAKQAATAAGFKSEADKEVADKADAAARALNNETDALYGNLDAAQAAVGSQDAFARQMFDVTKGLNENGKSLANNTEKGLANRQNILQAISAARANADAITKQSGSVEKGSASFAKNTTALYNNLVSVTRNKGGVDALFRSIGLIPPSKVTNMQVVTGPAEVNLRRLQAQLAALKDRQFSIYLDYWFRQHGVPPAGMGSPLNPGLRAAGGPVDGGIAYIVGERGPELFIPGANGQIVDSSASQKMIASAARGSATGNTIINNFTVNGLIGNPTDAAVVIQREVLRLQRNGYRT